MTKLAAADWVTVLDNLLTSPINSISEHNFTLSHKAYEMQRKRREQTGYLAQLAFILPPFLFVIALLPRLLMLDAFLTPDESAWVRRSRDFFAGVLKQDWAVTRQTGHPGVTTMWTGSMGILYRYWTRPPSAPDDLLTFVQQVPSDPIHIGYIAPVRFPTVILTSLTVVAFFWFTARLFDHRTALVASVLFALNPFHIAHSRVLHHDALATTFMTLSVLPMMGYWLHDWGRRWLLVSGVMAGLAFLSKASAMLLMPFYAIVGVWACVLWWQSGERRGWRAVGRLVLDGALWGAVAWLTYGLFWPDMWVEPTVAVATVFNFARGHVNEAHVLGHYFLGGYTQDPGPLFYPLVWMLRTTPLHLLGLAILLILAGRRKTSHLATGRRKMTTIYLCVIYVLFYVVMMTFGAKKQDRYLLPVFPILDLLAALGLVGLWRIIRGQWWSGNDVRLWAASPRPRARHIAWSDLSYGLLVAGVTIVGAVLALPHHPYYLTYYNPLLGGTRTAVRLVTTGWGEGLNLAAAYLNQKPNADHLKVTAWYHLAFAPYFEGQTIHFFSTGKQMSSDYLVIYQNQLQRQMPDPHLLAYYQNHYTPAYVARLKGVDYALVYAVPIERRTDWGSSQVPGKLILYGYRQVNTQPDVLTIRLVWEDRGISMEDGLWAALELIEGVGQPAVGENLMWQPCLLAPSFSLAEVQEVGRLVESECELHTRNLEPGGYSLHIGLGPSVDRNAADVSPSSNDVVDLLAPRGDLGVSVPGAAPPPSLVAPPRGPRRGGAKGVTARRAAVARLIRRNGRIDWLRGGLTFPAVPSAYDGPPLLAGVARPSTTGQPGAGLSGPL